MTSFIQLNFVKSSIELTGLTLRCILGKQGANIHTGNTAVIKKLLDLPRTNHPIQNNEKFAYDAWQTELISANSQAEINMIVQVQGEFFDGKV